MKRNKIIHDRWLRTLLLSLALLAGGGWMAWGQTFTGPVTDENNRPTIILKDHEENAVNWHDSVFHETKVIYVQPNMERELFIPELRNNIRGGADERFNWFVHWYIVDKNGNVVSSNLIKHKSVTIYKNDATLQGGDWEGYNKDKDSHLTQDYFVREQNGGLVWSKRIRDNIWSGNNSGKGGYGMDASIIGFTFTEDNINQYNIHCDVSFYQDGEWDTGGSSIKYTEPTLTKRYIFNLHKAEEIAAVLAANDEQNIELFEYDYPYEEGNLTINFSMPYMPDNYFWDVDGNTVQGKKFQYQYQGINDNNWYAFRLATRKHQRISLQQVQRIWEQNVYSPDKPITILVRVSDAEKETTFADKDNSATDTNEGNTKLVAKYVFNPQTNSGFLLDDEDLNAKEERWPRRDAEKFELIGSVDFDMGKTTEQLQKGDNMSADPFGYFKDNWTSYGFLRKGANILRNGSVWTSNQNVYGLFRSANLDNVSKDRVVAYTDSENQDVKYMWPATITNYTNLIDQYNRILYDRTAEISKEKNNEKPSEYGYFYYIDASNDAGKLVEVPVENICPNTELTVTAWVADMTRALYVDKEHPNKPLAPNINLLFKGVKHDKTEVVLHRFTSCDALTNYQDGAGKGTGGDDQLANINLMQWQQLCYKFVVNQNISDIESFHLEIQNNEPHTDGADYAIDDIRIFKTKPQVSIMQAGDLCDTELKNVRFGTDYSNILQAMGLTPGEQIPQNSIHHDVKWDDSTLPSALKEYVETTYPNDSQSALENYFTKIYYSIYRVKEDGTPEDEPLKIDYNGDGTESYYRMSYVSTRRKDMKWTDPDLDSNIIYSQELEIGKAFDENTDYIARVSSLPLDESSLKCDACALIGDVFRVSVTGDRFTIIKSGETETEIIKPDNVEVGSTYTISGVFKYREKENGPLKTLENAKFDWFIGTFDEFYTSKITVGNNKYTIQEAFATISQGDNTTEIAAIQNALNAQVYNKDSNPTGKYILGESSFEYKMLIKYQSIIGLPRAKQGDENQEEIMPNLYCAEPVLIPLGGTPPTIDPGDPDVPDPDPEDPDPEDPDPKDPDPENPDDPTPKPDKDPIDGSHVRSVRVGLVQIQDMVKENHNGTLRIPIHARTSEEGEIFVVDGENKNITVCSTSDKLWKVTDPIATLTALNDIYAKPTWTANYFKIQFNEKATGFREGFWYMVEIPYAVKDNDGNGTVVYRSTMKLTLKIVPEYVTWVGSELNMHNWNNDGPKHWRRSNDTELYTTNVANKNGSHNEAYTPMRFTKVTIYGKAKYENGSYTTDGSSYAAYPHLYELTKQGKHILNMVAPEDMNATIGAATKNIEYDLLADPDYEQELFGNNSPNPDKPATGDNHNYSCVRFYGNTCDEIYIKPESEILHTEYLTYNKAHVDYEMAPNRWYMLASPLKGVVSGDMYLPTGAGTPKVGSYARQETPAFGKINYNTTDYTRWKPAVYMRGWEKTNAWVFRPDGSTKVDYAIKGSWSNLYNDVDVPFTPGTGFSIGTKAEVNTLGSGNKVLFRLPKADEEYTYYGYGDGSGNETPLTHREGNGRFIISPDEKGGNAVASVLVPKTGEDPTGGMFGNPFVSHLDMEEFFKNTGKNTYYILTESGTNSNIVKKDYSISTGEDSDPNYVAPLQSFIVEGLERVEFTTNMIAKAPEAKQVGLRSATTAPAEEPLPQLRITATRDGVRNTAVVAGLVTASDSYVEGEDAALLINEEVAAPQVYTLAGNQMTAINVTPDLNEIPLGIYGKDANPVELSFKVSGAMKNVKLVDKQTGKHYDVSDGLTLTVPGNTSGRYFLNGSIATSNEIIAQGRIIFYNSAPGRIDISSVDPLSEVTVYDIAGRALRTLRNLNTPTASVDHLAPGIYVVRAESGSQTVSEKIEVK